MALLKYIRLPKNYNTFKRNSSTSLSMGWTTKKVVPDVIDEVPPSKLSVHYSKVIINEGNWVRPRAVKDKPVVKWKPMEETIFHAVCMVDPDAPTREKPAGREWHHWLVVNIPGANVDKGETLSEYIGAGPPKGTGLHRYVFLLFEQPGKISYTEPKLTNTSPKGRKKFSVRKFAEKYKLGKPAGGNFFEAGAWAFTKLVARLKDKLYWIKAVRSDKV